jgi:hypothetical protein
VIFQGIQSLSENHLHSSRARDRTQMPEDGQGVQIYLYS